MDTTIKAALVSGMISAVALLANNYIQADTTKKIERQKMELDFLKWTASEGKSQTVYCNLIVWADTGLFKDIDVGAAALRLAEQRPGSVKKDGCSSI